MSQLNTSVTNIAASVKEATNTAENKVEFLVVNPEENDVREFWDTLKKGMALYLKVTGGEMFEHQYSCNHSDHVQLFPTDKTNSNMLPDGFVLNVEEPEVYLAIIHKHEFTIEVRQCSLQSDGMSNTIIDYSGYRYLSTDAESKQQLPTAIYAAMMDFWGVNNPSVYDMPFVIDLFINYILDYYPNESQDDMYRVLKNALIEDMETIESTLTFECCYMTELADNEEYSYLLTA